jgi:uncharacterized membrane protein
MDDRGGMNRVLVGNIRTLLEKRDAELRAGGWQRRMIGAITDLVGSPPFIYLHVGIVALWIAINFGWLGLPRFDPGFVGLAVAASVEAIFLSTFVLITQNRMAEVSERRAELDLQISLLAEHEVTRLLQVVTAMARRLGAELPGDAELEELQRPIAPGQVLDELSRESAERASGASPTSGP